MADIQSESKAWKSSFTEGGVTYAASLFWQPLLNEDKPLPEIKEAAENILEGADLYVTRKGKSSQFGLAASSQGFTKGLPSAAVSLITSLGNVTSFLGVFRVDSGWWYICFRNDVILSDGDTLFVNEKDAKNQFISMLAVPDWDAIFAPSSWNIDDTRSADLGPLLERGLQVKLDKISGNNDNLMLAVIVACFAVVLWFAYSSLKDMFFSAPEEPVVAPVPIVEQPVVAPEPKPWENIPNPVEVAQKCYAATQSVVQVITPGWELDSRIAVALEGKPVTRIRKYTFGSDVLPDRILEKSADEDFSVELIGLCTDICVISNALILKARFPEMPISVDAHCCAGVTPALHEAALAVMQSCQIDIIR